VKLTTPPADPLPQAVKTFPDAAFRIIAAMPDGVGFYICAEIHVA